MANNHVSSLSEADTRLAALNIEILMLETERSELLRSELANAESRVEEIEAFIGVYRASSALPGSSKSKGEVQKESRPGPKPEPQEKKTKAAGKPEADPQTQDRRKNSGSAERAEVIKSLVKAAGKAGISARKLSRDNDMPYAGVLKVLNDGGIFKKIGEKRDRLYFLK